MDDNNLVKIEYLKDVPMASILHVHPNYELFYFHEGGGNYLIGDKIYALSPGDLILLHGMTLHCPNMNEVGKYVRTVVSFDPAYVRAIAAPLLTVDPLDPFERHRNIRLALEWEDRERVETKLAQLDACRQTPQRPVTGSRHPDSTNGGSHLSDGWGQSRFRLLFLELLLDVYALCAEPHLRKTDMASQKEQTVQTVISWVERHYTEQVSLDRIAAELHVNKHYLSRVFRELTGVTVFDYLYQRRINEAAITFLLEDCHVTEVCYRSGFVNLSHFSRMFKQRIGCSPDEYRRRHRKEQT